MNEIFQKFLFSKNILVAGRNNSQNMETVLSLANLFGISVVKGQELASKDLISFVSSQIGTYVPDAFYHNFPQSVWQRSPRDLLADQVMHYFESYICHQEGRGRCWIEIPLKRENFREEVEVKEFVILSEQEATQVIHDAVQDFLQTSRPLSQLQYDLLLRYVSWFHYTVTKCACKNTVIRLLVDTEDVSLAQMLNLSDVIKVVEWLNFTSHNKNNIKKLRLKNKERKFIAKLLDYVLANCTNDIVECYLKKALWCGLLHNIHYQPKSDKAQYFVDCMRSKGNKSVYSQFECFMQAGDIVGAVLCLKGAKGDNAILRQLNYILSRCQNDEDIDFVLQNLQANNVLILLQLLITYSTTITEQYPRSFKFIRLGNLQVHAETDAEFAHRQTHLSTEVKQKVTQKVKLLLQQKLSNKLGKVYISPQMKDMALPLQNGTSMGGLGTLATGSRLPLPVGKKLRAFTYWRKVRDIDLSAIGMDESGNVEEFSWRTMYQRQNPAITFSGDQTSGYYGGSEYFDINLPKFKKLYPNIRYLVFFNNVFTCIDFCNVVCTAGYMLRDEEDSGKIFEPQTVKSAFKIDCQSTQACLFALDLQTSQFVWFNLALHGWNIIAGEKRYDFLFDYLRRLEVINMDSFFRMMATQVVDSPDDADVIVSDDFAHQRENKQIIHSYDFEKVALFFE